MKAILREMAGWIFLFSYSLAFFCALWAAVEG